MNISYEHIVKFINDIIPKAFIGTKYEQYYELYESYSTINDSYNPKPKNVEWICFSIEVGYNYVLIIGYANTRDSRSHERSFTVRYEVERTNRQKSSFYRIDQKTDAPHIRYFLETEIMKFLIKSNILNKHVSFDDMIKTCRPYIIYQDYKLFETVCDYYRMIYSDSFILQIIDGLLAYKSVANILESNVEATAFMLNLRNKYSSAMVDAYDKMVL